MASITYLEVRARLDTARDEYGWTQAKIEDVIAEADNEILARLAAGFATATVVNWLSSDLTAPAVLKDLAKAIVCAKISGEAWRSRGSEGESRQSEVPPGGYRAEAERIFARLLDRKQAVVDNANAAAWATHAKGGGNVLHDATEDTSIFGGIDGQYPARRLPEDE